MRKKVHKDDIDRFYDYGVDISNRVIYMGSEAYTYDDGESGVDHFMAERAIKSLLTLDSVAPEGDKPITIVLNSPGGDTYHGLAIYDAIRSCKNDITIIGYGYIMSMGSIIFQAADKRILAPNSKFMIHEGYTSFSSNHPKINERWMEQYKRDDLEIEQLYLTKIRKKHPKFPLQKLREMLRFDTILNAQEAVDLGLADEVLQTN